MKWDDMDRLKYQDRHPAKPASWVLNWMVAQNPRFAQKFYEARLRELWLSEHFQGVAKYTVRVTLRGRVLTIQMNNPALKHNLSYQRDSIRHRLNELLGWHLLNDLIFV